MSIQIMFGLGILIGIIVGFFLGVKHNQLTEEENYKITQYDELQEEYDALEKEYEKLYDKYEAKKIEE